MIPIKQISEEYLSFCLCIDIKISKETLTVTTFSRVIYLRTDFKNSNFARVSMAL